MSLSNLLFKDNPLVTIAVPSFNQGKFLDEALTSIFKQKIPVEVFLLDGGSSDNSIDVIHKWKDHLTFWRSHKDQGQASAVNEGIALGKAPFVCWLNSDDWFLNDGLSNLLNSIQAQPEVPAVYGRSWNFVQKTDEWTQVWVEPFDEIRLALRCIISQPATLIRRSAWDTVGGLDSKLNMAMDYDLWWRIYKNCGVLKFVDNYIAVNRVHAMTKTNTQRARHYYEAIEIVRKHYGSVPIKWWLAQPYAVWFKSLWPF